MLSSAMVLRRALSFFPFALSFGRFGFVFYDILDILRPTFQGSCGQKLRHSPSFSRELGGGPQLDHEGGDEDEVDGDEAHELDDGQEARADQGEVEHIGGAGGALHGQPAEVAAPDHDASLQEEDHLGKGLSIENFRGADEGEEAIEHPNPGISMHFCDILNEIH